ncbi:MAG: translation initiation factor IF-2 [Candidatus Methanofastidiosia archaeon]
MIRQPIISVLGHVDHGKTTLLDFIRETAVASRESGGITQHIGATEIPFEVVEKICGEIRKKWKLSLPGLLFIDTPGHRAFTNLRRRGSSLADLAVLVIDINEGIQPQTIESINLLRRYKTPFIVACNKIDKLGWESAELSFSKSEKNQDEFVLESLNNKLWELMGELYIHGFEAERFDKIKDFKKKVSLVPISAKLGVGVPELLMLISGLSQRFLEEKLRIEIKGEGKGTVLEVKEEVGLGTTINVILYDGTLRKGERIIMGGKRGIVETKIRAILKPKPLDEIRDPKHRFDSLQKVFAACGIKLVAPNLEEVLAGSPLYLSTEENINRITEELEEIRISTETSGVIVKADTLGSLEALVSELKKKTKIKKADVGDVLKQDVFEAISHKSEDPKLSVIFAFGVKVLEEASKSAKDNDIKIFESDIIYKLIEDYEEWVDEKMMEEKRLLRKKLTLPGKLRIIPRYIFRKSKPAIVGVEILGGVIRVKVPLINNEGKKIGIVKSIKDRDEFLSEASEGMRVALSIRGCVVGRNVSEEEILFVDIPKKDYNMLLKEEISDSEKRILEEINEIKSKRNEFWYL